MIGLAEDGKRGLEIIRKENPDIVIVDIHIPDMAGYSDAKYMSRVFKEEVGMLPSEYRKKNS